MLLFIPAAFAIAAEDAAPCYGAWPSFALPADGATDVSPDVVPVVGVDAQCGDGVFAVTLTPDAGDVQTISVPVTDMGLAWLDELVLEPDTAYVLEVVPEEADWATITNHFTTGDAAVNELSGQPGLEVIASEFFPESGSASISLRATLLDANGDPTPWELNRGADGVVASGYEDGEMFNAVAAEAGDEICYTLTQFQADGVEVGTSDEVCVTVGAGGGCGCSTTSGAPLGLGLLLAALLRRR